MLYYGPYPQLPVNYTGLQIEDICIINFFEGE